MITILYEGITSHRDFEICNTMQGVPEITTENRGWELLPETVKIVWNNNGRSGIAIVMK